MASLNDAIRTLTVLGIAADSEADLDLIDEALVKRSYRKLALKLHPDKNKNDPEAETKFNRLKDAHDSMMNAAKRSEIIALVRGSLQRKRERELKSADRQKFASALEQRESEFTSGTSGPRATKNYRARHREMIEELQRKRTASRIAHHTNMRKEADEILNYPPPDDSNMDMHYWFDYAFKEPLDVRADRQQKFSDFILGQLS